MKTERIDPKTIGERLIKLRGDKSQEQVSRDLGISKSALSMYETGKRIPRDSIKLLIANYYKRTIQSIFFT